MVRFASICLLLVLVAHLDLELFQMDVMAAFLKSDLDEEIYMDHPIGLVLMSKEDKVYCLKRSICDLKQSSKFRCFRFYEGINSFDLSMVTKDHCVYVERITRGITFLPCIFMTYF